MPDPLVVTLLSLASNLPALRNISNCLSQLEQHLCLQEVEFVGERIVVAHQALLLDLLQDHHRRPHVTQPHEYLSLLQVHLHAVLFHTHTFIYKLNLLQNIESLIVSTLDFVNL